MCSTNKDTITPIWTKIKVEFDKLKITGNALSAREKQGFLE